MARAFPANRLAGTLAPPMEARRQESNNLPARSGGSFPFVPIFVLHFVLHFIAQFLARDGRRDSSLRCHRRFGLVCWNLKSPWSLKLSSFDPSSSNLHYRASMRDCIWLGVVAGASLVFLTNASSEQLPARVVSLHECVEMAITRNFDVQIERLSFDISRFNLSSAYGAYVPNFSFQAKRDFVSQPGDFDPKKTCVDFPYEETIDTAGPGLSGRTPFGLAYDFSAVGSKRDARTDLSGNTNTLDEFPTGIRQTNNYFAEAGINLRQHLLKDFWTDQDATTIVLRRKDLKISGEALRFLTMKTILAV